MKVQSSLTHSRVVPNLHGFLSSAEDILKNVGNSIVFLEVNRNKHSSKSLLLCSAVDRNSNRFGTT